LFRDYFEEEIATTNRKAIVSGRLARTDVLDQILRPALGSMNRVMQLPISKREELGTTN